MALTRRLAFASIVVAAALVAQPASGQTTSASKAHLYKRDVMKAFSSAGLKLWDPLEATWEANPALELVQNPHPGWSLGIVVYSVEATAAKSFSDNTKQWQASGFAARRVKNVVVVVVPTGRVLGKSAAVFPMPRSVATALASLAG